MARLSALLESTDELAEKERIQKEITELETAFERFSDWC